MGQRWNKIHEDTANIPGAAPISYFQGINIPGGPVQSVIMRLQMVTAAQCATTDVSTLLTNFRITLNGDVVHDFRAIGADNTSTSAGRAGYFYNSIGGRCAQTVDTATTPDMFIEVPIGLVLPSGNNRIELSTSWLASAAAVASGSIEYWIRYNTDLKETTFVSPSTSFTSAVAMEQIVVRVPQTNGGVVDSLFIQNDSDADELGTQGFRIAATSEYGISATFARFINNELLNGVVYGDEGASTTQQTYAVRRLGCSILPTFGLSAGDLVVQCDSSAATSRTFSPVIRLPVGASALGGQVQTMQVPANPSSVLAAAVAN